MAAPDFALHAPRGDGGAVQGGLLIGTAPSGVTTLALDGQTVALAPDRSFLLGFGRDALAGTLTATTADGRTISIDIPVASRTYNVQSIPGLPPRPVPDAEFEARRPAELAKITAARSGITPAFGWKMAFILPAKGGFSGVYGAQRILGGTPQAPHAGLDIAAGHGAEVVAPADGIVRLAEGPFTLEGNLVLLDHGFGLVSAFLHLSRIDVQPGQIVKQGEPIGRVGATGRATGPHLHWGLTWGAVRVDPQLLVTK